MKSTESSGKSDIIWTQLSLMNRDIIALLVVTGDIRRVPSPHPFPATGACTPRSVTSQADLGIPQPSGRYAGENIPIKTSAVESTMNVGRKLS